MSAAPHSQPSPTHPSSSAVPEPGPSSAAGGERSRAVAPIGVWRCRWCALPALLLESKSLWAVGTQPALMQPLCCGCSVFAVLNLAGTAWGLMSPKCCTALSCGCGFAGAVQSPALMSASHPVRLCLRLCSGCANSWHRGQRLCGAATLAWGHRGVEEHPCAGECRNGMCFAFPEFGSGEMAQSLRVP